MTNSSFTKLCSHDPTPNDEAVTEHWYQTDDINHVYCFANHIVSYRIGVEDAGFEASTSNHDTSLPQNTEEFKSMMLFVICGTSK